MNQFFRMVLIELGFTLLFVVDETVGSEISERMDDCLFSELVNY